ncbi:RIP metalloprotease RseP [candidate division WOR-3 bacterium]|uniref:Zinc metalloprotease n=1 Tax=candidate division WOR-3 bacterium TaxID=2052148 RepID=A0A9D5K8X2_UNCW3|nr:RIP metalloprotease RseP [candidate division WOR-3 bacterium]MBD3364522.1 RIP metalloprotease RseP [candidate division WOR-3 bacterium]
MEEILSKALDILLFVVLLLILIGFHEFGHLLAAKLAKIPVDKFSIGFGPAIFKWKMKAGGETTYQLSIIPLGGYVKFKGEDYDDPDGFFSYSFSRKTIVTSAGVIANFILAVIIYFVIGVGWGVEDRPPVINFPETSVFYRAGFSPADSIVSIDGEKISHFYQIENHLRNQTDTMNITVARPGQKVTLRLPPADTVAVEYNYSNKIGRVNKRGPAARAGIKKGDRIISIDGVEITSWTDLSEQVANADTSTPLTVAWIHQAETLKASLTPTTIKTAGGSQKVGIGVYSHTPMRPMTFLEVLWMPFARTASVTGQIFILLGRLIVGKESPRNLGSFILIASLTSESRRLGFDLVLGLLAYLSISLAIINLFPIPVLDGGRILMFSIEKIARRRLGKKAWTIAMNVGLVLLLALIGFTLFNDVMRCIG